MAESSEGDFNFLILPCDLRAVRKGSRVGYCRPGLERWAATHGLSLRHFLKHGILASEVHKLNDPFGEKVIEAARLRVNRERQGGS